MANQTYIGDGVYVSFDGWQIWLRTERARTGWHEIALEPAVYCARVEYANRVWPQEAREVIDVRRT